MVRFHIRAYNKIKGELIMTTKYIIKYNGVVGNEVFDYHAYAEQFLLSKGYSIIKNCSQKIWVTVDHDTNTFHEEEIKIIEVQEVQKHTIYEITEKILLTLLNQEIYPELQDAFGCQSYINLNINNQKFRIKIEEVYEKSS